MDGEDIRLAFFAALGFYLLVFLGTIAMITLVTFRLSKLILDPLKNLLKAVETLGKEQHTDFLDFGGKDELGQLGSAFVEMTKKLDERMSEINGLNRELKTQNQLQDLFLANTSHELRTPLVGMIGLVESVLEESSGISQDVREKLQLVFGSSQRLHRLINDLLTMSQLKQNTLIMKWGSVQPRALVHRVLELIRPQVTKVDVRVQGDLAHLPAVRADEGRLEQVLFNLLGNAVKFTKTGWVEIRVLTMGSKVHFEVADSGIGIPKAKQEEIFESFRQATPEIARDYGGTGLGLSISKALLHMMGATLTVESVLGKGSVFGFDLDVVSKDAQPLPPVSPGVLPPQFPLLREHWHILVVDDEPVNQEVIRAQLQGSPWTIHPCLSGIQALEAALQNKPDLVIMDVMMPQYSGFETANIMRAKGIDCPIIFLTAREDLVDQFQCLLNHGTSLMIKPAGKKELLEKLSLIEKLFTPGRKSLDYLGPGRYFFFQPQAIDPVVFETLGGKFLIFFVDSWGAWIPQSSVEDLWITLELEKYCRIFRDEGEESTWGPILKDLWSDFKKL